LNKIVLQKPFTEINKQVEFNGFLILPVLTEDTFTVARLPYHHRDPFDRIIISQCINKNLTLVTLDDNMQNMPSTLFGKQCTLP